MTMEKTLHDPELAWLAHEKSDVWPVLKIDVLQQWAERYITEGKWWRNDIWVFYRGQKNWGSIGWGTMGAIDAIIGFNRSYRETLRHCAIHGGWRC